MKDTLARYWFIASVLGLAIFYFLYNRRGRQLEELVAEATKQKLAWELKEIRERSRRSQEDYVKAMEDYRTLKRVHADLFADIMGDGHRDDSSRSS